MVGLLDISPVAETIEVEGEKVDIHGVSAEGLAYLIGQYPQLANLMSGGSSIDTATLINLGASIVASITRVGSGRGTSTRIQLRRSWPSR